MRMYRQDTNGLTSIMKPDQILTDEQVASLTDKLPTANREPPKNVVATLSETMYLGLGWTPATLHMGNHDE